MPTGIIINGLVKSYRRGRVKALNDLNATFLPGRTHGLIGPNGSGKTTLMGCLLGLLHRDAGTINIDGMNPEDLKFKSRLGYVPERLRFDMWMKAWDFMKYHDGLTGLTSENRVTRITDCLNKVGLEETCWQERLKTFSRGMLQRIGLAQALLGNPKYLLLDEPTSGMDPTGVILFRKIVGEESKNGCLVLLSSHQLSQVEQLCDEIHFIDNGKISSAKIRELDDTKRILRIRWQMDKTNSRKNKKIPASLKNMLIEQKPNEAFFKVEGDQEARIVIETLITRGFAVVEAIPDTSRLERFFVNAKEKIHD